MFARILLIAAAASAACANPAVNSLMDRVLSDLRNQLRSLNLDPAQALPFKVFVPKSGLFNNDLRANFTQGSLVGLSGLVRTGDCTYGRGSGSNMMFGCNVLLGSTQFLMNVDVQGDSGSKVHSISTNTQVNQNTYALIQVRGLQGYRAQLDSIRVPSVTATTKVIQGKLDLNESRFSEFSRQVNSNISVQLVNTLNGAYAYALNQALSRYTMP